MQWEGLPRVLHIRRTNQVSGGQRLEVEALKYFKFISNLKVRLAKSNELLGGGGGAEWLVFSTFIVNTEPDCSWVGLV